MFEIFISFLLPLTSPEMIQKLINSDFPDKFTHKSDLMDSESKYSLM